MSQDSPDIPIKEWHATYIFGVGTGVLATSLVWFSHIPSPANMNLVGLSIVLLAIGLCGTYLNSPAFQAKFDAADS